MKINEITPNIDRTRIIGYHGSSNPNITKFSQEFRGKNTGSTDTRFGVFFFTDPLPALMYLETLPVEYVKDDPDYKKYLYTDVKKEYEKYSQSLTNLVSAKIPELSDTPNILKYLMFDLSDDPKLSNQQKKEIRDKLKTDKELAVAYISATEYKKLLDKNIPQKKINSDYLLYGAIYKCELTIEPKVFDMQGTDYTRKQYNLMLASARDEGRDSLFLKNVHDAGDYGPKSNVIIVFDENNIKILDKTVYENYPSPSWMKHDNI